MTLFRIFRHGEGWDGMARFGWTVVHGGKSPPPGEVVAPHERLSWPRTIGLGGQHVVAMFGATFVFPVLMGLSRGGRAAKQRH